MIRILACGKLKEKWAREAVQEYLKRCTPYEKTEVVEVPDEKAPENYSDAERLQVINKEGENLLKRIGSEEYVILLDLAGKEMTSEEMAGKLQDLYTYGKSRIAFVIGGSLGVSDALKKRADLRWKLGGITLPHQLCRIVLCEQIYRCFKIQHGEPYHK